MTQLSREYAGTCLFPGLMVTEALQQPGFHVMHLGSYCQNSSHHTCHILRLFHENIVRLRVHLIWLLLRFDDIWVLSHFQLHVLIKHYCYLHCFLVCLFFAWWI